MNSLFRKKSIAQIQADAAAGFSDAETVAGDNVGLRRSLGTFDLTMLGIAAIVGAGIFALVGEASNKGGPGVVLLFIFASVACGFAALCYAEFASKIPIAGSAYTYAYASFGELIAWIIGWDLLVEYAIGNIAVAISWSDYFTRLLKANGINVPAYFSMDYLSASRGFTDNQELMQGVLAQGQTLDAIGRMTGDQLKTISDKLTPNIVEAYTAWTTAPQVGGIPIIADFPALGIVFLITCLVYIGIRESKTASNIMVGLKLAVILLVIVLGAFYVKTDNWTPFLPNGFGGVMSGVAAVFFAYIGFDALSTTAEECKDPYKTLPRGMIYSLIICTVLYIVLALVLTGMVSYTKLAVGDPLAFVFGPEGANLPWVSGIIAVSAVIAIATVLLVFQLGQPRLWMAMSRDGLLPKIFSSIHPRFRTPWFSTILTGFMVAIPALFMNLSEVTDLSVIGTLFAFTIVCAGVLVKDKEFAGEKRFVPYINSQFIAPVLFLLVWGALLYFNGEAVRNFFTDFTSTEESAFYHKIPYFVFVLFSLAMTILCFVKRLSLIPVLGIIFCTYLMTELGITNWTRFAIWLLIGLAVYFLYSYKHSKLHQREEVASQ
ncbi:MAG: amino acid permease [Acidobacteria bacterium]|jgi:amino acid transporter|nr:amino acid permease [Acidobacteriota bacterium]